MGYIEQEQLWRYYQKAKAFLMPVQWKEPFRLSLTEAMACGTPVIALRRGSIPEVVDDGVTGFVVESIGGMIAAVDKVSGISRKACRTHIQKHFSIERMVDGYEAAFETILRSYKSPMLSRRVISTKLRRVPKKLKQQS